MFSFLCFFFCIICVKGFSCGSVRKESACNAGDWSSIPGLGRSPGKGKGYPLQYSGLENSMDCIVHCLAKSRIWLSDFQPTHLCEKYCNLLHYSMGFPCDSAGKESTCNMGDLGLIPGLGRCPGEGDGYPPRYSVLENSMECIVHGVAKSRTWLSGFHFTSLHITVLYSRLC